MADEPARLLDVGGKVHVREASTPTEFLIQGGETRHQPGLLVGDCSCGESYYAPAGVVDEVAALEDAHVEHVDAVRQRELNQGITALADAVGLPDVPNDTRPRLIVADRYSRAVDWCVHNVVQRADVRIVTTCAQLRGLQLGDYRVVMVDGPGSPYEYIRLLELLADMQEADLLRTKGGNG